MTKVVTMKLTEGELQLLDRVAAGRSAESRSQLVRMLLRDEAARQGLPEQVILVRVAEREAHRPIRSPLVARLVGPRRPGQAITIV